MCALLSIRIRHADSVRSSISNSKLWVLRNLLLVINVSLVRSLGAVPTVGLGPRPGPASARALCTRAGLLEGGGSQQ
jgi:hypothetical protein